jgi:molybdopterin-guanine dinucleotide biosynthesis protein A
VEKIAKKLEKEFDAKKWPFFIAIEWDAETGVPNLQLYHYSLLDAVDKFQQTVVSKMVAVIGSQEGLDVVPTSNPLRFRQSRALE